jgi:predicted TIM-barrel fold metal-dependent hydrolase
MTITSFERTEVPETLQGIKVIDCDTHFVEPPDLWTSRAPAKYKDHVPYMRRVNDADQWFLEDHPLGEISVMCVSNGREKHHDVFTMELFTDIEPASYDPKARAALMDDMGVHAQIVYPNAAGFGGNTFGARMPEDLRTWCVQAYNDTVAEWAAQAPGRLYPQALVPFWSVEAAAKEARRIKEELGLSGIAASNSPHSFPGTPDYGSREWDPFWEVCSEYELPVSFHVGSGIMVGEGAPDYTWHSLLPQGVDPSDRRAIQKLGDRGMLPTVVANPAGALENVKTMSNLMFSGILDRYPKLQFFSVESGIGWVPFFLEYAEYSFDEMAGPQHFGLQRRPTEYFRDHMHVSFWFEKFGPRMAEDIGVRNILFESDFPHPVCLYPTPVQRAGEVLTSHSHEVRKQILETNAAEMWKIPVD